MNPNEVLKVRGLSQRFVARQMGISDSYMSKLLSGDREWTDDMQRLFALATGIARQSICYTPVEPEKVG